MLRTNPLTQFSLTTDNLPYLQVGDRHRLAVDTFRKLPEHLYKLDSSGIPRISKVEIDDKSARQNEVEKFTAEIYDLNEPWAMLITDRAAFSHELIQFPHQGFRRRYLIPDSVEHKYQSTKIPALVEATNDKDKSVQIDISTLGSTMDTSDKARIRRAEHLAESRRWHSYLKMEPYLKIFGTFGLFMPDIGYALTILGAIGIGTKHQDPKVRKSSIKILSAIAQGTILKLNTDLEQLNHESALKQAYAKDAKSVLDGIFKLLRSPWFGINDENDRVKSAAKSLESDLIDAYITISKLIKPRVIDPCKVLKS